VGTFHEIDVPNILVTYSLWNFICLLAKKLYNWRIFRCFYTSHRSQNDFDRGVLGHFRCRRTVRSARTLREACCETKHQRPAASAQVARRVHLQLGSDGKTQENDQARQFSRSQGFLYYILDKRVLIVIIIVVVYCAEAAQHTKLTTVVFNTASHLTRQ